MKRAFTLIELLVVIAIIAILAAILFPVFARAKAAAKKTQAISNVKNQITGSLMYTTDYDDSFGFGTPYIATLGWSWDRFIPDKSLLKATTPPAVADGILSHMGNAMQPYTKNINILTDPVGLPQNPFPAGAFTAAGIVTTDILSTTPGISYTYNGLLQAYMTTLIENSAATVVWWPGQGKRALQGTHYASPQLICGGLESAGCRYVPANPGCSALANGGYSFYTRSSTNKGWDLHNRTLVYAYADGHASSRPNGVYMTGPRDPRTDPFALYNGQQVLGSPNPSRYWEANYCHSYLFRPDFDYQNWGTALQAN